MGVITPFITGRGLPCSFAWFVSILIIESLKIPTANQKTTAKNLSIASVLKTDGNPVGGFNPIEKY